MSDYDYKVGAEVALKDPIEEDEGMILAIEGRGCGAMAIRPAHLGVV